MKEKRTSVLQEMIDQLCLEYVPYPVICLDLNYVIVYINNRAIKAHDFEEDQTIGKDYTELCKERGYSLPFSFDLSKQLKNKKQIESEQTYLFKDKNDFSTIKWHISQLFDMQKIPLGFLFMGEEKTNEVKAIREKNEAINLNKENVKILSNMAKEVIGQVPSSCCSVQEYAERIRFHLESIIEQIPASVYWKSKDYTYLGCNDYGAKLVGLSSRKEIVGKTDYDLSEKLNWEKGVVNSFREDDVQVLTGHPITGREEPPFLDAEQNPIFQLSSRVPLYDKNEEIAGILGISIDITEQKKKEKELKQAKEEAELANKIKTEFITNMEHDIRTPAQGLASYAKEMLDAEPDEERKESWQVMARAGKRLLSVLNGILEFTRLESGTLPVFEEPFSLKETLLEVVDMEFPAAKVKGLNLECVIADDIPEYVLGDELRINRTLINLISNAIKFTPSGFIRVSAEQTKKSESMVSPHEVMIAITIEDSGVGISKDKVRQIFEKFYRGDASNQEKYTGSGLGLYLTKKMLEDIGGQITVCSEVNQGTRFTCCIPFKISFFRGKEKPLLAQKRGASEETTQLVNLAGLRILLVEDDFIAQHVGNTLLSNTFQCQVDLAATGKKAIDLSRTKPYDLILLDLGLPDQTGVEVAHKIRSKSQNSSTPIIAVTAHSKESSGEKTKRDMNDFITKPLDPHKLREIIDKWITPSHLSKLKMKKADQAEKQKGKRKSKAIEKKLESSDKVIDLKLGINASGAGEDFVKEMLAMLHAELPEALEQLDIAYRAKDFKTMRKIAHKLRGGASYCGTPRLKHAAALLDEALLKKKKAVATFYKELIKEIHLVQKEHKKLG